MTVCLKIWQFILWWNILNSHITKHFLLSISFHLIGFSYLSRDIWTMHSTSAFILMLLPLIIHFISSFTFSWRSHTDWNPSSPGKGFRILFHDLLLLFLTVDRLLPINAPFQGSSLRCVLACVAMPVTLPFVLFVWAVLCEWALDWNPASFLPIFLTFWLNFLIYKIR